MSGVWVLVRRVCRLLASLWTIFTVVFLAVAYTPNPNTVAGFSYIAKTKGLTASTAVPFAKRSGSLVDRYLEWAGRLLTLDLGTVPGYEPLPASAVLGEALTFTLVYFLPAVVIAVVAGTLVQLYAVSSVRRLAPRTALAGIVAVSIPSFLVAYAFEVTLPVVLILRFDRVLELGYATTEGPFSPRNLRAAVWPFLTTTLYLFGIQLRYAGAELSEYVTAPFVKTARAKGAGPLRVGRHVFPHAAVHLLTAFVTDMLGMVLIGMYVIEWLTDTPGFGTLTIDAIGTRVPALVFTVVLLPVVLATVVNFLQDVYYAFVDPRISEQTGS